MPQLLVLAGDGVGAEVVPEAVRVVDWFVAERGLVVDVHEEPFGVRSWEERGTLMTDETWQRIVAADAILFGAIGAPEYTHIPAEERQVDWLLEMRQQLDLYQNLRPVRAYEPLLGASTLRPEVVRGVDMVIVRELCGGAYFGEPRGITELPDGTKRAVNSIVYTTPEIERIARDAFALARTRRNTVCSVDKANVLEFGALWREVVVRVHGRGVPRRRAHAPVRRQLRDAARAQPGPVRRDRHREPVRRHHQRLRGDGERFARHAAVGIARPAPRPTAGGRRCTSRSTAARPTSPARASPTRWVRSSASRCACATRSTARRTRRCSNEPSRPRSTPAPAAATSRHRATPRSRHRDDRRRPAATGGCSMREPYVFPMSESPFSPDVSHDEAATRIIACGAEVITDEIGRGRRVHVGGRRGGCAQRPTLRRGRAADAAPVGRHRRSAVGSVDAPDVRQGLRRPSPHPRRGAARVLAEARRALRRRAARHRRPARRPHHARASRSTSGRRSPSRTPPGSRPRSSASRRTTPTGPPVWAFDLARAFFPFMSPELVGAGRAFGGRDPALHGRPARPAPCRPAGRSRVTARHRRGRADAVGRRGSGARLQHDLRRARGDREGRRHRRPTSCSPTASSADSLPIRSWPRRPCSRCCGFSPPAQHVARLAGDDMVCQDVQLRAGQVASASIVAACRDPRRYANPHELDVARVAGKQLYFGAGAHYCLGASLAKLGLGIAFETLARRFPDLALRRRRPGRVGLRGLRRRRPPPLRRLTRHRCDVHMLDTCGG